MLILDRNHDFHLHPLLRTTLFGPTYTSSLGFCDRDLAFILYILRAAVGRIPEQRAAFIGKNLRRS